MFQRGLPHLPADAQAKKGKTFVCPICKKEYRYRKWLVIHINKGSGKHVVLAGDHVITRKSLSDFMQKNDNQTEQ